MLARLMSHVIAVALAPVPDSTPQPTVQDALAAGDLDRALEQAQSERQAQPSFDSWEIEAQVLARRGQWQDAIAAHRSALALIPSNDPRRADVQRRIDQLDARSRGTDSAVAAASPPPPPAPPPPQSPAISPADAPPGEAQPFEMRGEKLVHKWYFWVTLAAIVASAAAITGIAIKASRQNRGDALGPREAAGATLLRF